MTQHRYDTEHEGKPVAVLMGWDRPLQGFFMVIERHEGDVVDEAHQFLYSNLSDPHLKRSWGVCRELGYFVDKLATLGLSVPPLMVAQIQADAAANRGNRYVTYSAKGEMQEALAG